MERFHRCRNNFAKLPELPHLPPERKNDVFSHAHTAAKAIVDERFSV
jgi:hypothetical protein